ncbi:MAG: hypothetical protein IIY12_00120 [Clostridia bacterium]|nr:hypothetical protein [Clostridia bacterium]
MKAEMKKNKKPTAVGKKILWIAIALVAVMLLLVLADVGIAYGEIHRWTHPEKTVWQTSPAEYGLDYYTFEIETENGTVCGWTIAAQQPNSPDADDWVYTTEYSDKTVILAPNYDNNREATDLGGGDYFVKLCSEGYNVITFDWTGTGFSDGEKNVFALDKVEELKAVVKFAAEETKASFLALQGVGFACYPAAMATAECEEVDALILDSCYDTFENAVLNRMEHWTKWNFFPVNNTIRGMFSAVSGVETETCSMTIPLQRLNKKSIYFVQGSADELFGSAHISSLSAVTMKNNQTEVWLLPDVGHLRAASYDSETYGNKMTDFLQKSYQTEHSA